MSDTKTKRWESVEDAVKAANDARASIAELTNKADRTDEDNTALTAAKSTVEDAVTFIQAERAGETIAAEGTKSLDWSSVAGVLAAAKADETTDPLAEVAEKAYGLTSKGEIGVAGTVEVKALTVVEADSAGVLGRPARGSGDPTGRVEQPTLAELINWVPVEPTATEVEHPRLKTRNDNASFLVEWDPTLNSGAGGFPHVAESDYRWELVKTALADIGVGMPMSRRASLTEVRSWAETLIRYDIVTKINDQILNGDGTANSFVGIMNTTGILKLAHVEGSNEFDMISAAISLNAGKDTAADTVVFKASNQHAMRTLREGYETVAVDPDGVADSGDEYTYEKGTGAYLAGGPAAGTGVPSWGLAQTVASVLPEGVGLVGQFAGSALRGRYQTEVEVKVGDQYMDYQARGEAKYLTAYRRGVAVEVVKPSAFILVELVEGAFADAGITA